MGYIKSGSTVSLVASLTYKGRKNLLNSVNDTDSKIVSFTISDNDVNYDIAENLSLLTSVYDIPANGFIPDFTGDYESCIKATNIGVDENVNKPFILQNLIQQISTYVWDSTSYSCLTGTMQNTVLYGLHNTGNALYKNITKLVNGIVDKTYNVSVPINLIGDNLKVWLADKNNVKATINDNNLNTLVNTRILSNPTYCLLDIDFVLTADQFSPSVTNDTFITVGNIVGGNGKYKVSIDNGLTFYNVTGSTYTFYNLPENQTRSIIVEDTQATPFMSKKSVITPSNNQAPQQPVNNGFNIGFKLTSQNGVGKTTEGITAYDYNATYSLDLNGMPNGIPLTLHVENIIKAFGDNTSNSHGAYKIILNNNIIYEGQVGNVTTGSYGSDILYDIVMTSSDMLTIYVDISDNGTNGNPNNPVETRIKINSVTIIQQGIIITHSGDAYVRINSGTPLPTYDPYYNYPIG